MWWWLVAKILCLWKWLRPRPSYGRRRRVEAMESHRGWHRCKPPEVRAKIIHIKAMGQEPSCREVANAYNRSNAHKGMTVGKTWVSDVIRTSQYEIQVLRSKVRGRRLTPGPPNRCWGLDLTGKVDEQGTLYWIAGVLDHGSRADLSLIVLKDKTTITLLRLLLDCIECYGRPKAIRTDNERIFTSRLFRFGLWLLDIKHQLIDVGCPWQNGRIERFFGTLKGKLNLWSVANREQLEEALRLFRVWYNHVRPHQHLNGMVPAEAWVGIDIQKQPTREAIWFETWDGLLTGYYIRR